MRKFLRAKIHNAVVTTTALHYEGSIAIDEQLLEMAEIAPYEAVQVWNLANGARLETYALPAPRGSREICVNGAAARWFAPGDRVIIASFAFIEDPKRQPPTPRILILDERNEVVNLRTGPVDVTAAQPA